MVFVWQENYLKTFGISLDQRSCNVDYEIVYSQDIDSYKIEIAPIEKPCQITTNTQVNVYLCAIKTIQVIPVHRTS